MTKKLLKIAGGGLFLLILTTFAGSAARAQKCVVEDPTGSPLNVRSYPNGRVTGKLRNGYAVYVEDYSEDEKGRQWARVGAYRKGKYVVLGFVLRDFIACN